VGGLTTPSSNVLAVLEHKNLYAAEHCYGGNITLDISIPCLFVENGSMQFLSALQYTSDIIVVHVA
jgi:hypothetical protein